MSHGGGGGDRWLVSYADMMTLLFVLFFLLFALGQLDITKYKELSESFIQTFSLGGGGGGPARIVDPGIAEFGGVDDNTRPAPIIIQELPSAQITTGDVVAELGDILDFNEMDAEVSADNSIEGILISLSEQMLFAPGSTQLVSTADPLLQQFVKIFVGYEYDVKLVGHTAAEGDLAEPFTSTWELSTARAIVVANKLIEFGFPPERITVAGQAEFHMLYADDGSIKETESRVDVIIVYPVAPKLFDIDLFDE